MGKLAERLAQLTVEDVRPVVRAALRDPEARPLEWAIDTPEWVSANPTTRGVARARGSALTRAGDRADWTAVLKIIGSTDLPGTGRSTDANYWRREALALSSGLLDQRSAPFVPVELLARTEPGPNEVWLWLECLETDDAKKIWTTEDQLAAAHDLGAFNAVWSQDPPSPKTHPWLARHWLRGWIEYARGFGVDLALARIEYWSHPRVAAVLSGETQARFVQLMNESAALLGLLEDLPVTLTHHDAQQRNLFRRQSLKDPPRRGRTIAIDWSFLGLSPVGADLGHMIGCELQAGTIEAFAAAQKDSDLTAAYLAGLAGHGWRGDDRAVRFARALSASLQLLQVYAAEVAWLHSEPSGPGAEDQRRWPEQLAAERGAGLTETMTRWAAEFDYLLDLGDEARALAPLLDRGS